MLQKSGSSIEKGALCAELRPFYCSINFLIQIPLHCTEGRNPKMDGFRWVELGLIREVGLKGDENACSDA